MTISAFLLYNFSGPIEKWGLQSYNLEIMKNTSQNIASYLKIVRYLPILFILVLYSSIDLIKFIVLGSMVDLFADLSKHAAQIYGGIIFVSVCAFLSYVFDVAMPWFKSNMAEKKAGSLRLAIGEKLLRISYEDMERMNCGEVLSKAMSDIDRVQVFLEKELSDFLILFFKGILGCTVCLLISWKFVFTFFLTVPVVVVLSMMSGKKEEKLLQTQKIKHAQANDFALDCMNHLTTVKIFNLSGIFGHEYSLRCEAVSQVDIKIGISRAAFSFINAVSQLLPTIVMMIVGAVLVTNGELTTGKFTIMLAMSSRVANLLGGVQGFIYQYQGFKTSGNRLMDLLNISNEEENDSVTTAAAEDEVLLHQVVFSRGDCRIIDALDLNIKKGGHVAFVGKSGCGKSTLMKLILGFYYCDSGSVFIKGIENVPGNQGAVRAEIGAVLQDNYLFPISIRDNIGLFVDDYEEEDMLKAVKAAGIYEFIQALPEGFDTVIGNGSTNISGGQRQRLCIARAYMKKPEIMLLDEPTSAMDTKTEDGIAKSMEEWMIGKTMITIAHRLSTIKSADRIYYMEKGRIVESGTYEQLCDRKGAFYDLYKSEIISR